VYSVNNVDGLLNVSTRSSTRVPNPPLTTVIAVDDMLFNIRDIVIVCVCFLIISRDQYGAKNIFKDQFKYKSMWYHYIFEPIKSTIEVNGFLVTEQSTNCTSVLTLSSSNVNSL
jgi:hypothetical protein